MISVPSSPADGQTPWAGGPGPQGVGRRRADRASWPALILCSPQLLPSPAPYPACPPRAAVSGERSSFGKVSPIGSLPLGLGPHSQERPAAGSPGPALPPLLPQRTTGTSTSLSSAPRGAVGPLRAVSPGALQPLTVPTCPPAPTWPLCCSPGTSHTLASPPRGPLSAKPGQAGGRGEAPAGF